MTSSQRRPFVVWGISDGRKGNENQIIGLMEALERERPIETRLINLEQEGLLSSCFSRMLSRVFSRDNPQMPPAVFQPPWPDICIGCGRKAKYWTAKIKHWSLLKTLAVQLLNPRSGLRNYDLVIPPEHDQVSGRNVFSIVGNVNRISDELLKQEADKFADVLDPLPDPKIALLIGGDTKRHRYTRKDCQWILTVIDSLIAQDKSLMITSSTRTPKKLMKSLEEKADHPRVFLWTGEGENPYYAFLAHSEVVMVTSDSTNMLTEACTTGKPSYLIEISGQPAKFEILYEMLQKQCGLHAYQGRVESWSYPPLTETEKCSEKVWQLYDSKLSAQNKSKPEDSDESIR